MAAKYDCLHLEHMPRGIGITMPGHDGPIHVMRDEFGMSFAMKMALLWAIPRARTIYLHKRDSRVEFKITVEHIGGMKVI